MADGPGGANQDGNFDVNCRDIKDQAQVVQNQVNYYGHPSRSHQSAAEKLDRIEGHTTQILDVSCKHGYVETKALKACMDAIARKGICIIIGRMGTGKTTLGNEVLRRYQSSMRPLVLDRPEDAELILDPTCKDESYIIFFDDISIDINPNVTLPSWKLLKHLTYEVRGGSGRVKLLMSFQRNCEFPLMKRLFEQAVATVNLDQSPPNDKEKVSIYRNMLTASGFQAHLSPYGVKKAASQVNAMGFPTCCELFFSTPENVDLSCYKCKPKDEVDGAKPKAAKTDDENSVWESVKMLAKDIVLEKLDGVRKTEEEMEKHVDESVRKWNYYLDIHDNTVLHYIVERGGAEESLSAVLSRDVTGFISSQNSQGQTALHLAVLKKLTRAAQLLLEKGCDATLCDAKGRTATYYAADQDTMDMIEILDKHGALTLQSSAPDGVTPIHIAVYRKVPPVALCLLMATDDVNAVDSEGNTFLHHAARAQASSLLSILQELRQVTELQGDALVEALVKKGINEPMKTLETIQEKLKGLDLNKRNNAGRTAIAEAAFVHSEVTQTLLNMGADETLADNDGNTPLLHAIQAGNEETALQLLKRSVISVFLKNSKEDSPLILALRMKLTETVKMIIRSHADMAEVDSEGNTPLMLAVASGDESLVKWMLRRPACQATLSMQNQKGETAMDLARNLEDDTIRKHLAKLCGEETSVEEA